MVTMVRVNQSSYLGEGAGEMENLYWRNTVKRLKVIKKEKSVI